MRRAILIICAGTVVLAATVFGSATAHHRPGHSGGPKPTPTVSPPPPPEPSEYGPTSAITCPAGAVFLGLAANLPNAAQANPQGTTFCISAGTHFTASPIFPRTGQRFIGQFGAVIDANWSSTDPSTGIFAAHNADVDSVTIQNLIIQGSPTRGIHAFTDHSDNWLIDHNEVRNNQMGVHMADGFVVSNNYIHHNISSTPDSPTPALRGGGYGCFRCHDTLMVHNEIAFNGSEQKFVSTQRVTVRDNFVHDNRDDGIWFDGDNTGALIEGNLVTDHPREGIFYEISGQGIIRNNTILRSGANGIFVSTSKNAEIYGNTIRGGHNGITLFLTASAVGGGAIGWDLANNYVHDNRTVVGTGITGFAAVGGTVPSAYYTTKGNRYESNDYVVPSLTGTYWKTNPQLTWAQWQGAGFDTTGTRALP